MPMSPLKSMKVLLFVGLSVLSFVALMLANKDISITPPSTYSGKFFVRYVPSENGLQFDLKGFKFQMRSAPNIMPCVVTTSDVSCRTREDGRSFCPLSEQCLFKPLPKNRSYAIVIFNQETFGLNTIQDMQRKLGKEIENPSKHRLFWKDTLLVGEFSSELEVHFREVITAYIMDNSFSLNLHEQARLSSRYKQVNDLSECAVSGIRPHGCELQGVEVWSK